MSEKHKWAVNTTNELLRKLGYDFNAYTELVKYSLACMRRDKEAKLRVLSVRKTHGGYIHFYKTQ